MLHTPKAARRAGASLGVTLTCLLALAALPAAPPRAARAQGPQIPVIPPGSAYRVTHLVSDSPGMAPVLSPQLVNPSGVAPAPGGPFWVANRGTRTAQPFRSVFGGAALLPDAAQPTVLTPDGQPRAAVFNATGDFDITPSGGGPAVSPQLIFALQGGVSQNDGLLAAWHPVLGASAQVVSDNAPFGERYTGITIGASSGGNRLYVAEYPEPINVFDANLAPSSVPGNFADPTVPADFHPFNVLNLGGSLYVTYAKRGAGTSGFRNGAGDGLVRKFNTDGVRDPAFAVNNGPASQLNAPWGMAVAPASFGVFAGALLVGNFAESVDSIAFNSVGHINAYDRNTGAFLGTLQDEAGQPIFIEGLRALAFGAGGAGGDPDTLYFTAGPALEGHGLVGAIRPTTQTAASLFQFSPVEYVVSEEGSTNFVDVTVTREGDVSTPASVHYATFDETHPVFRFPSQKSDYQLAVGRLDFAPGETSKTFRVLIVNDGYLEGDEVVKLVLSNPEGVGAGLGSPRVGSLKILGGDLTQPALSPNNETALFVIQHYFDFLHRAPDLEGGLFWINQINECGSDNQCREVRRINVSAAFFLSIEFRQTGLLNILTHQAAFGRRPLYGEFMVGTQSLQRGFVFGAPGHEAQLEANKQRFFRDFVAGAAFADRYPTTLTPAQFVDALYANAGVVPTAEERAAAVAEFTGADTSDLNARARALRRVAENEALARQQFNASFVLMQYFGYLRRDPDEAGFQFWLGKLNDFNGDFIRAEMVKAFISSIEYRERFGPS